MRNVSDKRELSEEQREVKSCDFSSVSCCEEEWVEGHVEVSNPGNGIILHNFTVLLFKPIKPY